MRNWAIISESVRRRLCDDGSTTQNPFKAVEKILDTYWESSNDLFQYNCRFSRLRKDVFQPHVVPTKIIKRDDQLSEDLLPKSFSWLSSINILRCYSTLLRLSVNVQRHTFVDAGENAYAAVSLW